ncbi:hypothetical protein D3C81_1516670 [compost metagenome]
MQETGQRQAEVLVQVCKAGEAGTGNGCAVISAITADDFATLWLANGAPVVPDQFDRGVVGFRT